MIFFASSHVSLSVTSFMPRSEALSLMVRTAGVAAGGGRAVAAGGGMAGGVGSDDESETVDPTSGCAKGTKAGAGEAVVDMLRISRGTGGPPPIADPPPMDAPPMTEVVPRKVSGDIPP